MYTSVVGKTFLKAFNQRQGTNYTAREFFDHELFETLFNHKRYLMWPGNSPFVQGISKKKPYFNVSERSERLEQLHLKIQSGENDASIAMGFPASDTKEYATTSGFVTDLDFVIEPEDIYHSWIGSALAIGVAGGFSLLFNDPEITYRTYEGWQHYRNFLNESDLTTLSPNKLTSWNGRWLAYRYDEYFDPDFNFDTLLQEGIFSRNNQELSIPTVPWSHLFFGIAQTIESDTIMAYIFTLGSTNKTIGFIPFHLKSGKNLLDTYQSLFGRETYKLKNTREFESWFGRKIKQACEFGSIGIQALQPESLKKYYGESKNLQFIDGNLSQKKDESNEAFQARLAEIQAKSKEVILTYQIYKTWLVAMLSKNKTEISDYSRAIAKALLEYRKGSSKTDRKNFLEKEFFKTNKNEMLKSLSKIVTDNSVSPEIVKQMNSLRDQIHYLSKEEFNYFVLLLKFDYAYAERQSND